VPRAAHPSACLHVTQTHPSTIDEGDQVITRYQRIALAVAVATTGTAWSLWPPFGPAEAHARLRDEPSTWMIASVGWLTLAAVILRACKIINTISRNGS